MNLNSEQQQAVDCRDPRIVVMASPGSGKTTTLTARISSLVNEGVSPYTICALTFTNKAAQELKKRVGKAIGSGKARNLRVGTFHSLCHSILRSWGTRIGIEPHFTVYDENLRKDIIDEIQAKMGTKLSKKVIDLGFNEFGTTGNVPLDNKDFIRIFNEYRMTLKSQSALDFNMLLTETLELLKCEPEVCNSYRIKWVHILVDESQDTSQLQYDILNMINPVNLFLCGDVDQALYSWRGAKPELLLERSKVSETITLETCYRCPDPVAEAANALIENNNFRYDKKIVTDKEGPCVYPWSFESNIGMFIGVARKLEYDLKQKDIDQKKDVFILARTNWIIREMANAMGATTRLKYQLLDRQGDLFGQEPVKAFINTLEMRSNGLNDYSASQSIAKAILSPQRMVELRIKALEIDCSLSTLIYNELPEFSDAIEEAIPEADVSLDNDVFETLLNLNRSLELNVLYPLKSQQKSIGDFMDYLFNWRAGRDSATIRDFLRLYWARHSQDAIDMESDSIKLMTIHGAKGLEAPHVWLIGASEGTFPNKRSNLEEERRLFYVAMTRAITKLTICWSGQPSQFIEEAGVNIT